MGAMINHRLPVIAFMLVFCIGALLSLTMIEDFARESDFLRYHLANQLQQGHGPNYQTQEATLLVLSPVRSLLLSLIPAAKHDVMLWLGVFVHASSAGLLFALVRKHEQSQQQALFATLIWAFGWPLWNGIRSEYPLALLLVLTALQFKRRPYLSGLVSGLAVMFHLSALVPIILMHATTNEQADGFYRKFLLTFTPLIAIWWMFAFLNYDHVLIPQFIETAAWQDYLWLALFIISLVVSMMRPSPALLWILATWTAVDLLVQTLWYGVLPPLLNPAIAAVVAITLTTLLSKYTLPITATALIALFSLLILAPPQTHPGLERDLRIVEVLAIPQEASVAHSYSDALTFALDGERDNVYRLDGKRNSTLNDFVQRDDLASAIIRYAPDYIITSNEQADDAEITQVLNSAYELLIQLAEHRIYRRRNEVGDFESMRTRHIAFTPETQITAIGLDRTQLLPEDTLRIRLDWQLQRSPELDLGVRLQLIDFDGDVVGSSERTLPPATWSQQATSTYHMININENAERGAAALLATLEYRAGILGTQQVARVLITDSTADQPIDTPLDEIGPIQLHDYQLEVVDAELQITTTWTTREPIVHDYSIFAHVTSASSISPIAQTDGRPAQGRFPTDLWPVGEAITDTRSVAVDHLASGQYIIRIGFYAESGERLRDTGGDSIILGEIAIDGAGHIQIDVNSNEEN